MDYNQQLKDIFQNVGQFQYQKAIEKTTKLLQQIKDYFGESSQEYALITNILAFIYSKVGDYNKAEPLFLKSLEIRGRMYGKDDAEYANGLVGLSTIYYGKGEYDKAEQMLEQALIIRRRIYGEGHPNYATVLNGLGVLYLKKGMYAKSQACLTEAIKIYYKAQGEDHPNFAGVLTNLATLYTAIGSYDKAEQILLKALGGDRTVNNPDYAATLNSLGVVYQEKGQFDKSEEYYKRAIQIYDILFGKTHPSYLDSLENLADVFIAKGEYDEAEEMLREVLVLRRRIYGEFHPDYATNLDKLADLYSIKREYENAESLYSSARSYRLKLLGKNHPDYGRSLNKLSTLYAATRRVPEAFDLMKEAIAIENNIIEQAFSIGSEKSRLNYLEKFESTFNSFLSLILRYFSNSSPKLQVAFDLVLRRKAIWMEAMAPKYSVIRESLSDKAKNKTEYLSTLRNEISRRMLEIALDQGNLDEHQQSLEDLLVRKEILEIELGPSIQDREVNQGINSVNTQTVALVLPSNSTLIEFVRFDLVDFEGTFPEDKLNRKPSRYLAFILSEGNGTNVSMVDLGEAEAIDQMIIDFRSSLTNVLKRIQNRPKKSRSSQSEGKQSKDEVAYSLDYGSILRKKLFEPLLYATHVNSHLILAPDGELTKLPFEILPSEKDIGRHVIDDYLVTYVSTGRDVLQFGTSSQRYQSDPIVAADPDYDLQDISNDVTRQNESRFAQNKRRKSHSKNIHFESLKDTRDEANIVAEMLSITAMVGKNVLKSKLKTTHSPRIFHLATHSFFLPSIEKTIKKNQKKSHTSKWPTRIMMDNPMLRSGLALAGANTRIYGGPLPSEAENGLLTAYEILNMDLSNTELVVLSAIETGLDRTLTGEAAFSLRRAFQLAGADTTVTSLWKMPTKQTNELITYFYENLLSGKPRSQSLREAKLLIKAKYGDPFMWGGFTCHGDPSPLLTKHLSE